MKTRRLKSLDFTAEGTGISQPLSEQVNLLGGLLGDIIAEKAGAPMLALVEELRLLCKRATQEDHPALLDEAAARIASLSFDDIVWLLHAYTAFFHLVNQAEKQEIIRINRARAQACKPDEPRSESIEEALYQLKTQGYTFAQVQEALGRLDIQPTLTAHPTDARRRSILFKQQRIAHLLTQLRRYALIPEEQETTIDQIQNEIALLLATDEVRAARPTVAEEVENGLYFIANAIWETIPRIYQDVRNAVQRLYAETPTLPVFLRFRSWIGSDRDGNPYVTPAITRQTLALHRRTALQRYVEELRALRRELSLSDRQVQVPDALYRSIEQDAAVYTLDEQRARQHQHEPYRLKLSYMIARLEDLLAARAPTPYPSAHFVQDLSLLARCLTQTGYANLVEQGHLGRLLVQAEAFGYHLVTLDIRQHSRVHEQAIAALLSIAGVTDSYAALDEAQRLDLLGAELLNPRPLLPRGTTLPEAVQPVLDTFGVIREMISQEPAAIGSYIVSMTHAVSDLLEVMILAKEMGLWRYEGDRVVSPLDIVPLFETIDDLKHAHTFLDTLFAHPLYRKHLAARGTLQEIMLGYSDSNKDGGYWMANWALHTAQDRIGRICRAHDIDFRLFHGRGGTVGRGGGHSTEAILAMPSVVHNGRIRFTEQGEVISFRYALAAIARRHLEQIVHAMIRADALEVSHDETAIPQGTDALLDRLAAYSMDAYRALVQDDALWFWYIHITPIEQISRLPIASRPVSRKSADEVDLEGLRAIPWVFAWTQTRYMVPGWYGIGAALHRVMSEEAESTETLRHLYQTWPFFTTIVDNAQREMARARFEIAQRYASRLGPEQGASFHEQLVTDFERARAAILRLTDQTELLDNNPVFQKSISLRNPYTDVLNLLQIELMQRYRHAEEQDRAPLRQALFLSINGIAAALQSTG